MITLTKWLQRKLADELIFSKGEYEERKNVQCERCTQKGKAKRRKKQRFFRKT